MIKVDLITGFLGSGKTTFIKKYVQTFLDQGLKVCILENDFGAVNVDMMLLQDIEGDCELEMIAGGCDNETHRRRMKTKFISMGMRGFDRVLVEPSGIFDVDEFFDLLNEEPLNQWYEVGNVIALVDACLEETLTRHSQYILTSQIADAGKIVMTKVDEASPEDILKTKEYIQSILKEFRCNKDINQALFIKDYDHYSQEDWQMLQNCGYQFHSYMKIMFDYSQEYNTQYLMNLSLSLNQIKTFAKKIMADEQCGHIMRMKGFVCEQQQWYEMNATRKQMTVKPILKGQDVIIVIGENLNKEKIEEYLKK